MAAAFDYNAEHAKMTAYVNFITMQYPDCIFKIAHYFMDCGYVENYKFQKAIIITNSKNNFTRKSRYISS